MTHQIYCMNKNELFMSKNFTRKVVRCVIFCFKLNNRIHIGNGQWTCDGSCGLVVSSGSGNDGGSGRNISGLL